MSEYQTNVLAINDVHATKLSVKCHDCAKANKSTLYLELFYRCKSGNLRFKSPYFSILRCLLHKLYFIDLHKGQAEQGNNLLAAILACLGQALILN